MPSKYRKVEDLPKPGNPNVVIKETPAQMLAAISWRCVECLSCALDEQLLCARSYASGMPTDCIVVASVLAYTLLNLLLAAPHGRTLPSYHESIAHGGTLAD